MNVHFPQDEISRAEAYNIVNANEQYIVPTSGDPIRGLIQVQNVHFLGILEIFIVVFVLTLFQFLFPSLLDIENANTFRIF